LATCKVGRLRLLILADDESNIKKESVGFEATSHVPCAAGLVCDERLDAITEQAADFRAAPAVHHHHPPDRLQELHVPSER
jgi:hypothetical protein